jgi:hypothetical protein
MALLFLRPGTPSVALAGRMEYLAGRPLGWSLGWGTWALCALLLVAFLALVAEQRPSAGTRLSLSVACAGAAVDLTCDALYVTVLPDLAAQAPAASFLPAERAVAVASIVVANGLYSAAALLAAASVDGVPPLARGLGWATGLSGLALAAAGFLGSPRAVEVCTGPTVGFFMAWAVVLSRALDREPARR